jgi:hypothetical protein
MPGGLRNDDRDGATQQQGVARRREGEQADQLPLIAGLTHREDQGARLGHESPRNERQTLQRGPIEPLRVVHHADERPLVRNLGSRLRIARPIRNRSGAPLGQTEGDAQRVSLRAGQVVHPVEDWRA